MVDLGKLSADLFLLRCMLLEEWRLQRSFVGSFGSYFFPLVIFLMSLVLVVVFPFREVESSSVLDFIHIMMFLYGLGVGGIALIGEQVMARRIGQVNFLLRLPQTETISFRRSMAVFYVKEVFFYVLYSILPFGAGIVLGGLIAGLTVTSTLMVSLTVGLVFGLGMSLSFMISGLMTRSRPLGAAAALMIVLAVVTTSLLGLIEPVQLLHPLYFYRMSSPLWLLLSLIEVIVLSVLAVLLMKERISPPARRFKSSLMVISRRYRMEGRKGALMAKEWLELRRSGTIFPIIAGFAGPLLAVYGLVYLLTEGFDARIGFNVVFFSALIGFFGVMTYSWLNNVEPNESFDTMPVTVAELIKVKLTLYFIFTTVISTVYITAVGLIENEAALIPLGVLVGLSTNLFVAFVTARLTGLRTNTMLLDATTLLKFMVIVTPPLVSLVILSFYLGNGDLWAAVAIIVISFILISTGLLIGRSIGPRWSRARFGL